MNIARYQDSLKRLPTQDSEWGMLIRLVMIAGLVAIIVAGFHYASGNAHGEVSAQANTVDTVSSKQLQRELNALRREVYGLRADNASLRSEVTTLTSKNGVVDVIIGHLRDLKAQDQAILGMVQPSANNYALENDGTGSAPNETSFQAAARHQIVTPKAKVPPIPSPRPEQVAVKEEGKDTAPAKEAAVE